MHNICFDLATMHLHGSAFFDFLRLRKALFVDTLAWDIPHNAVVEMDQYDNPEAHYSLVIDGAEVVGGARIMPMTAVWGSHSCMIADAIQGKLPGIPRDLSVAGIDMGTAWECTRLAISERLTARDARTRCLALIVDGLIGIARARGGERLVSLSPAPLLRALRALGHDATLLGEPYRSAGDGRVYAAMTMPAAGRDATEEPDLRIAS